MAERQDGAQIEYHDKVRSEGLPPDERPLEGESSDEYLERMSRERSKPTTGCLVFGSLGVFVVSGICYFGPAVWPYISSLFENTLSR